MAPFASFFILFCSLRLGSVLSALACSQSSASADDNGTDRMCDASSRNRLRRHTVYYFINKSARRYGHTIQTEIKKSRRPNADGRQRQTKMKTLSRAASLCALFLYRFLFAFGSECLFLCTHRNARMRHSAGSAPTITQLISIATQTHTRRSRSDESGTECGVETRRAYGLGVNRLIYVRLRKHWNV